MLSEKITSLFKLLDVTCTDVAHSVGCAPSNFSRLRHGSRIPKVTSPTINKLINGVFAVTDTEEKRTAVCHLCGATAACSDEMLREALMSWLYDGIEIPKKPPRKKDTALNREKAFLAFGKRLDTLLQIVGMSNNDLSRKIGLDTSYVSRLRRGERMPVYHSKYITSICYVIVEEAVQKDRLAALSELTWIPESILAGSESGKALQEWLFQYGSNQYNLAVDHLLSVLISDKSYACLRAEKSEKPDVDEIRTRVEAALIHAGLTEGIRSAPEADAITAVGETGLRSLAVRFLLGALEAGERELFLYSDQPMHWMSGEYAPILQTLMIACLESDMHVNIVHNIDRPIKELFGAIEFWMPLVLTGQVTSYINENSSGQRFSHTVFVRPSGAGIEGFCAKGSEDRCYYHFHESREATDAYKAIRTEMIGDSKKLIEIGHDTEPTPDDIAVENVLVNVQPDKVVVKRTEDPKLSFTFVHPMMCQVFYRYFRKE